MQGLGLQETTPPYSFEYVSTSLSIQCVSFPKYIHEW